jgi:serine/threonine protein kinase
MTTLRGDVSLVSWRGMTVTATSSSDDDGYPRPFGAYTLLAKMAPGGMGALYLAGRGEPGMEKLCVIKTVLPHLADKEYVARFRDEAKVVVRLSHGNLVPVIDAGTVASFHAGGGEELYLAMEHIDGKDLRAVWNRCAKRGIAFPVDVAVYIARELCRGLHHAHGFGGMKLVHRDVSPPNVLLSYFGEVKLTDFGLASSTLKTEHTAPGIVYGKISYMSPEQARGEPLDGRTDLYAVAVMLWELLTGRQLYPAGEPDLIQRVRDGFVDPPSLVANKPRLDGTLRVPSALDAIVVKALARDRTLRYADCEALRVALAGFLAQTAPTTDASSVAAFLAELFGDEIERERAERQHLVEKWQAERLAGNVRTESPQTGSEPVTVSLGPAAPPVGSGVVGTYLDGRYLVKRLIGEGGMGLVYEAEHVEIGRRVAVKVLHAAYTRHAEVVARFRSEARAATRIGHPNIIDVFDSGTTVDGAVYFVMEFLDGRDLAEAIRVAGTLPAERAIAIAREICQALAAAHKAGIVHRDMKPENVFLVDKEGKRDLVKVLDFGIAKTLEGVSERAGRLTHPGLAMGTPEYMAPEQAAGQPADARADVYAVGAILYEMLSGRPPHEGATIMEVLSKKATEPPVPLEKLRPDVPRELERLVMRTLAMNPADRPQSMEALAAALGALSGPAARVRAPRRRRAPFVAAGAVAAAGVIAATALWVRGLRPEALPRVRAPVVPVVAEKEKRPPESPVPAPPAPVVAVNAAVVHSLDAVTVRSPHRAPAVPHPAAPPVAAKPSSNANANVNANANANANVKANANANAAGANAKPAARPAAPAAPSSAEARRHLAEARAAAAAGRWAQAEALFSQVEAAGVERGAALTGLAEVAFQRGEYLDSVRLGRRAVAEGGGVAAKMVLGNSFFKLKKYDDAIGEYREVLRVDQNHAEAKSNLAAAEKRRGGG